MMEIGLACGNANHTPENYELWGKLPVTTLHITGQRNWCLPPQVPEQIERINHAVSLGFNVKVRTACEMHWETQHNIPWEIWGPKALERLQTLLDGCPGVREWQVTNERNVRMPWDEQEWRSYFDFVMTAHHMIMAANPNNVVIGMGLNDGGRHWQAAPAVWLDMFFRFHKREGKRELPFKWVSIHLWRHQWEPSFLFRWNKPGEFGIAALIRSVRDVLVYHGHPDMPIEIGECGKSIVIKDPQTEPIQFQEGKSPKDQADFLRAAFFNGYALGVQRVIHWDWSGRYGEPGPVSPFIINGQKMPGYHVFCGACRAFNQYEEDGDGAADA